MATQAEPDKHGVVDKTTLLEFFSDASREHRMSIFREWLALADESAVACFMRLIEIKGLLPTRMSKWRRLPENIASAVFRFLDTSAMRFKVECTCRRWRSLSQDGGRWHSLDTSCQGLPDVRVIRRSICNIKKASIRTREFIIMSAWCRHISTLFVRHAVLDRNEPSPTELAESLKKLPDLTSLDLAYNVKVAELHELKQLRSLAFYWSWNAPPPPAHLSALHIRGWHGDPTVLLNYIQPLHELQLLCIPGSGICSTADKYFTQEHLSCIDAMSCVRNGKLRCLRLPTIAFTADQLEVSAWPYLSKVPHLDLTIDNTNVLPAALPLALPNIDTVELYRQHPDHYAVVCELHKPTQFA